MIISTKSQLGLRFKEDQVKLAFLETLTKSIQNDLDLTRSMISKIESNDVPKEEGYLIPFMQDEDIFDLRKRVSEISINHMIDEAHEVAHRYFLITDGVIKPSQVIKIGENFTGRTMKDIKFGKYTYLLGKNEMVRFIVEVGVIKGFYYNDEQSVIFEFGIDLETGKYYFTNKEDQRFSRKLMWISAYEKHGYTRRPKAEIKN